MKKKKVYLTIALVSSLIGVTGEGLQVYGEILIATQQTQKTIIAIEESEEKKQNDKKEKIKNQLKHAKEDLNGCRNEMDESLWEETMHQIEIAKKQIEIFDNPQAAEETLFGIKTIILHDCKKDYSPRMDSISLQPIIAQPANEKNYNETGFDSHLKYIASLIVGGVFWGLWGKERSKVMIDD